MFLDADSPGWLLVLVGVAFGIPQGLNGLANQNALHAQADPARMASAGLLRTFTYLGALLAAAANAAFFQDGAPPPRGTARPGLARSSRSPRAVPGHREPRRPSSLRRVGREA
ncbi:hypothetical protein [Streptomyces sp. KL116D]|uniref:hypothetical protein n=1 Tax=Streptomyces sp. KL116D TaxID=3045152 RepID=UPI003556F012